VGVGVGALNGCGCMGVCERGCECMSAGVRVCVSVGVDVYG